MERIGKQTKEITLKRIGGDEFQFTVKAGNYFIDNEEKGVIIETGSATVLFDHQEYKGGMDKDFWEGMFCNSSHDPINEQEAIVLNHVVNELIHETNTGVNQLYLDDEIWIDGYFELVI